jgi:hypothetical protein
MSQSAEVLWSVASFSPSVAAGLAEVSAETPEPSHIVNEQLYTTSKRVVIMDPAFQRRFFDVLTVSVDEASLDPVKLGEKARVRLPVHVFRQYLSIHFCAFTTKVI